MKRTVFDYLYRDAGNHKAFGRVVLDGHFSNAEQDLVTAKFDGGTLFVAEQLNIPGLYDQLYRWSGGPTDDDHCWHECLGFRRLEANLMPMDSAVWGTVGEFIVLIEAVECWNGELSPHFYIGAPIHEAVANLPV